MSAPVNDRELLGLAARAAGIDLYWDDAGAPGYYSDWRGIPQWESWNPLVFDGDALRLAVAISTRAGCGVTCLSIGADKSWCEFHFVSGSDAAANTRRAIVIAAAEIGRGLASQPSTESAK
jgi:hypothetical protein